MGGVRQELLLGVERTLEQSDMSELSAPPHQFRDAAQQLWNDTGMAPVSYMKVSLETTRVVTRFRAFWFQILDNECQSWLLQAHVATAAPHSSPGPVLRGLASAVGGEGKEAVDGSLGARVDLSW